MITPITLFKNTNRVNFSNKLNNNRATTFIAPTLKADSVSFSGSQPPKKLIALGGDEFHCIDINSDGSITKNGEILKDGKLKHYEFEYEDDFGLEVIGVPVYVKVALDFTYDKDNKIITTTRYSDLDDQGRKESRKSYYVIKYNEAGTVSETQETYSTSDNEKKLSYIVKYNEYGKVVEVQQTYSSSDNDEKSTYIFKYNESKK